MGIQTDWNYLPNKTPTHQGFYLVLLENSAQQEDQAGPLVAEWRERSKEEGKCWWLYSSEDPTVEETLKPLAGVVAWTKATKRQIDDALIFYRSELPCRGIYWDDLAPQSRSGILGRTGRLATQQAGRYTRADLLRSLLEVLEGGASQTPEYLAKVRALLAQEEAKS